MAKQPNAPWKVVPHSWQHTSVYDADSMPICRLDLEDWGVGEDNQPELEEMQTKVANLIAAAPELLEALRASAWGLRNLLLDDSPSAIKERLRIIEVACSAIAKAEGNPL